MSSSAMRSLFEAARNDGPPRVVREEMWDRVAMATGIAATATVTAAAATSATSAPAAASTVAAAST